MKQLFKKIQCLPLLNKIVTKFIFSHVFLASFSIALVGIFLLTATNNFIKKSVNDSNLEKAKATAAEIYLFVKNTFNLLSFATEFPDINSMESFRQTLRINKMKVDYSFYRNIFVVDTTGTVVASTVLGQDSSAFTDTTFFPDIFRKEMAISPVFIAENKPPFITVTTPIYQFSRIAGALAAEVDVNFIWSLVDSLSMKIPNGIVYILDAHGIAIAHPDRKLVYSQKNFSELPFVQNLLKGKEGVGSYTDPVSGEKIICAYTPVEELHWGIVVSQSEATAFAVSRSILNKLIIIIIGSTVLASLLAVIITRNLVKPLKSLVEGVKRLYEGSPPGRIEVPGTEELATLAREFNRMTENLENVQKKLKKAERLATMSKFASVVAHEIRNPFNSIVINMQVLKRGMARRESYERLANFMDSIDAEIRRIDGLIQNYLSLTKPPDFNLEPHDINAVIDELIILQKARAKKQSITIERHADRKSLALSIDADQIKQAFLNIILNAFEAMPEGGTLAVGIHADHGISGYPGMVRITFADTGAGIKPEHLSEVFDYFYTSKRSGTGLGLTVTQQIIEGHNGTIEIDSSPGSGTTVSIFLPK